MFEKILDKYRFDNGIFTLSVGRYAGRVVERSEIIKELMLEGVQYEQIPIKMAELETLCKPKSSKIDDPQKNAELIEEVIRQEDFIKDFRIVKLRGDIFTYVFKGNRAQFIQLGYPHTKDWVDILLAHKNEAILNLKSRIRMLLNAKNPHLVTPEMVAEVVGANLDFSLRKDLVEHLHDDLKPISLSTSNEMTLYKLDYEHLDGVSSRSLNPHMAEFLSRISDHEYLCAIIWLMVHGIKAPYVVYLLGTSGGEGKSSFLNAVAKKIESFHSFEDNNQFSNFHMYGKAMIILSENKDCYLLQKQTVKAITGGSPLSCEQKGKGSFTGFLSGILFVDSNDLLKLKGEDYEKRRLRLFRVSKPPTNPVMYDATTYTALLSENFNAFLNYCRVCYEQVGDKNAWLVPASPRQLEEFPTLVDPKFMFISEQILVKIFKDLNLEYAVDGEISSELFFKSYYKMPESKDKFGFDNLRDYLYIHKKVTIVGDKFHGLRQIPSDRTSFVLPST